MLTKGRSLNLFEPAKIDGKQGFRKACLNRLVKGARERAILQKVGVLLSQTPTAVLNPNRSRAKAMDGLSI
jgi:hypothetical protein